MENNTGDSPCFDLNHARSWLALTRAGQHCAAQHVDRIRYHLRKAKAKPEDIGTTEEELRKIIVDGYRNEAMLWLGYAQHRKGSCVYELLQMRHNLEKANLTLEEIGTDGKKVHQLLVEGYKTEAMKSLTIARKSGHAKEHVHIVREHLKKAGAIPEDIGTTKDELRRLSEK